MTTRAFPTLSSLSFRTPSPLHPNGWSSLSQLPTALQAGSLAHGQIASRPLALPLQPLSPLPLLSPWVTVCCLPLPSGWKFCEGRAFIFFTALSHLFLHLTSVY